MGGPENGGRGLFTESIRADSLGREKARIIMLESGSRCTALGGDHCSEWPATAPSVLWGQESHYFSLCGVVQQMV